PYSSPLSLHDALPIFQRRAHLGGDPDWKTAEEDRFLDPNGGPPSVDGHAHRRASPRNSLRRLPCLLRGGVQHRFAGPGAGGLLAFDVGGAREEHPEHEKDGGNDGGQSHSKLSGDRAGLTARSLTARIARRQHAYPTVKA